MNPSLRIASLFACALSFTGLAAHGKGQPDWSSSSQLFSKKHHGSEVAQLSESEKSEVARRNGITADELVSHMKADKDLAIDKAGFLHYTCEGLVVPSLVQQAVTATGNTQYSAIPNSTDAFKLHSLPGAQRVVYLDFTGHTTSGTYWNSSYTSGAAIVSAPFDTDGDNTTFSSSEQDLIKRIWARVAEEYAPFQVNVTTEDPGLEALRKTSTTDTAYGIRVVISPSSSWYGSAGGVAYVGSFSASSDLPCFIFSNLLGPNNEKYVADAIAHEAGHSLGLSHDGTTTGSSYYQGHGDWAPIMGVGYYKAITQWSKGEYANANNTQDDIAVIAANGAPLALDDNGDTMAAATVLTGPSIYTLGVIEKSTDADYFRMDAGAGTVSLSVAGTSNQPNLDIVLELVNSSGTVVASANPTGLSASISTTVSAGIYYLKVSGAAYGVAASTGYSTYGSLGEYVISGTIPASSNVAPTAVATASVSSGYGPLTVTFNGSSSTDSDGSIASYAWNFGDGTTSTAANPTKIFSAVGTYTVKLTVTDNLGSIGSCTTTITVTQDPDKACDLYSLVLATRKVTSGTASTATIRVLDRAGRPVSAAVVSLTWSGSVTGTSSVSTDSTGYAVFTSKTVRNAGTGKATVNSVTPPASYSYDASLYSTPLTASVSWTK